jgi:hypothetical protein
MKDRQRFEIRTIDEEGRDGRLEDLYRFQIKVTDRQARRCIEIEQPVMSNLDAAYIEDLLNRQAEGMRQHIINFARLVVQAFSEYEV